MSPEDVQNEIKLIFARACAASLEKVIDHILSSKKEDRAEEIEAVAAVHATTCTKLLAAFNQSLGLSGLPSNQPSSLPNQLSGTRGAEALFPSTLSDQASCLQP